MAQKVQAFPQGLRELIGRGDPPPQFTFFPEFYIPVIETTPFFLLQIRDTISATALITGAGAFLTQTVPGGELWWLHTLQADTDLIDADQLIAYACAFRINGQFFNGPKIRLTGSQTGSSTLHNGDLGNLILKPGDEILGGVDTLTVGAAGSISVTLKAVISRMSG